MAADRQLDAQLFRGRGEPFWVWMQPCLSQQFPPDLLLCAALLRLSLPSPAFSASPVRHTQQLLLLTPFQVGTIPKSMGRTALKTASTSPALAPGGDEQSAWKILHRPLQAEHFSGAASMMGTEKLLNVLPTTRQLARNYHSSYSTDGKNEAKKIA